MRLIERVLDSVPFSGFSKLRKNYTIHSLRIGMVMSIARRFSLGRRREDRSSFRARKAVIPVFLSTFILGIPGNKIFLQLSICPEHSPVAITHGSDNADRGNGNPLLVDSNSVVILPCPLDQ